MVAEGSDGFVVLVIGYATAVVFIEAVEEGAPSGEKAPEATGGRISRRIDA